MAQREAFLAALLERDTEESNVAVEHDGFPRRGCQAAGVTLKGALSGAAERRAGERRFEKQGGNTDDQDRSDRDRRK